VTAVLLAGGKSRRMGQDKAHLRVTWEGVPMFLWERQLAVLHSIEPDDLLISGGHKEGYPESIAIMSDDWVDVGPLGGIATCLNRIRTDLLLVLAVDMPGIEPAFLKKLSARAAVGCGVVPVHQNRFEPLAAVYPATARDVAIDQIEMGELALQRFSERLLREGLVTRYNVESFEQIQLLNWNTPEDVH
jgi:molybdenum cofactor guanylyltransferase